MENNFIIETFEKQEITFDFLEHDIMVNATEMAKPFGKRPRNFMRLESTKKFINALIKSKEFIKNIQNKQLTSELFKKDYNNKELNDFVVKEIPGQFHSGTFMCQDLAIYFAMWLSPEFAVWVTQTIRKLFLGNDPIKTRRLLQEIPKLFQETKTLKSQARKLKIETLDIDAQKAKRILRLNLISIETKIKSLIDHAAQLDLFDTPEEIGRRMIKLSQEKVKIEKEIIAADEREKEALNFDAYLNLQKEIVNKVDQLAEHLNNIRSN